MCPLKNREWADVAPLERAGGTENVPPWKKYGCISLTTRNDLYFVCVLLLQFRPCFGFTTKFSFLSYLCECPQACSEALPGRLTSESYVRKLEREE